jgi:hypothetical protein
MSDADARGPWSGAEEVLRAVLERDRGVLEDAELLRNHLLDRMPESRSDINLLVAAVREGIPARMASASAVTEATIAELAGRLATEQGLTRDRAEWAVRAWLAGLGRAPVTGATSPPPVPSPRRFTPPVLAVVAFLVVLGGLAIYWWARTVYTFERLAFFYTDGPLAGDAGEIQNYHAWCEAGAELRTSGPPPHRCPIVTPFGLSTPLIKVELRVAFRSRSAATVTYRCTLADRAGRVVAAVSPTHDLARDTPGRPDQAVWLTAFERPAGGWTPGRYKAACVAPDASIEGWLDIR